MKEVPKASLLRLYSELTEREPSISLSELNLEIRYLLDELEDMANKFSLLQRISIYLVPLLAKLNKLLKRYDVFDTEIIENQHDIRQFQLISVEIIQEVFLYEQENIIMKMKDIDQITESYSGKYIKSYGTKIMPQKYSITQKWRPLNHFSDLLLEELNFEINSIPEGIRHNRLPKDTIHECELFKIILANTSLEITRTFILLFNILFAQNPGKLKFIKNELLIQFLEQTICYSIRLNICEFLLGITDIFKQWMSREIIPNSPMYAWIKNIQVKLA